MTHDEPFQPDVVNHDEEAAETANAQAAENVLSEDQARQVLVPVPVVPPVEPTEPDAPAPAAPPADPGVQPRQMATPAVEAPPAVAKSEKIRRRDQGEPRPRGHRPLRLRQTGSRHRA